jgi:hypothetical protein
LRRGATFLRKIGIEIGFDREGRSRTRVIRITTAPNLTLPEQVEVRPSAPSFMSALASKSSTSNGFAITERQTVANDADGNHNGSDPTVSANPLSFDEITGADGKDANLLEESDRRHVRGHNGRRQIEENRPTDPGAPYFSETTP